MTMKFNVGDIVRFKPTGQIGVGDKIDDRLMQVDFFAEGEYGYSPPSFEDCYELLRAAVPNPDSARLDWMILRNYPGDMSAEEREFVSRAMREHIDAYIRLDAEQGAAA